MNEQLQQAVAALIEKSIAVFETGADFMAAEIPDVVRQLLLWHGIRSAVECGLAVLVIVIIGLILRQQWVYWNTEIESINCGGSKVLRKRVDTDIGALALINLVLLIPALLAIDRLNLAWLQIWIAPKIFLIEYAAKLIK